MDMNASRLILLLLQRTRMLVLIGVDQHYDCVKASQIILPSYSIALGKVDLLESYHSSCGTILLVVTK